MILIQNDFKIYKNRKPLFEILIIIHNIVFIEFFKSNKLTFQPQTFEW